jgi:hypothetical protein
MRFTEPSRKGCGASSSFSSVSIGQTSAWG